jgi:hypothetical protein
MIAMSLIHMDMDVSENRYRIIALVILFAVTGLAACSHVVAPRTAAAVDIYTPYGEQIPGKWVLVIDDSAREAGRSVSTSSLECSAHNYPMNVGSSVTTSVQSTIDAIFEDVETRVSMPTGDQIVQEGLTGAIGVRLDTLQPRVSCQSRLWLNACTARIDVSFGATVRGPNGQLFGGSAGSSKVVDGSSGGMCGKISDLLAQSFQNAEKEALERLAEKLSNSGRIRSAFQARIGNS